MFYHHLSEIGELKFEDIIRPSKILLNDPPNDQNNAHATEEIGILLEDFGRLQLDGTDSDSSDAGSLWQQKKIQMLDLF